MSDAREAELLRKLEALKEESRRLHQENELLRQKLDALARRLFGARSEQLDKNQLLLLLQEAEAPGPAVGKGSGPEGSRLNLRGPAKPHRRNPGTASRVCLSICPSLRR